MLRVKELLKQQGKTVQWLSDKIGIAYPNMSNIVNEKASPSLQRLQEIASALGIELWELFTESTSKEELTALIQHKQDFYRASTLEELRQVVDKIEKRVEE